MILIGIIVYSFRKSINLTPRLLNIFSIILSVILILAFVSTQVNILKQNLQSFRRPANELLTGAIFTTYQLILIYFTILIWMRIFNRNGMVHLRTFVNTLFTVIILFVFAFFFVKSEKWIISDSESGQKNNNIAVVLGAAVWSENKPSPSLAARVDKAIELYRAGRVKYIQLTGSNAPGELSEAEVAYKYLRSKNINDEDIFVEDKTTSTNEQIFFIKNNLAKREDLGEIIIVSDAYHLKRVKEICKFYNIDIKVASSDLKPEFENLFYYKLKESVAILVFWFFAL